MTQSFHVANRRGNGRLTGWVESLQVVESWLKSNGGLCLTKRSMTSCQVLELHDPGGTTTMAGQADNTHC